MTHYVGAGREKLTVDSPSSTVMNKASFFHRDTANSIYIDPRTKYVDRISITVFRYFWTISSHAPF